jgi:hypothetical protein
MAGSDTTTIGRARVVGWPARDTALAARLAVASGLARADLRPPGLPPAAVLIVRFLPPPAGRRAALRPGGRVDPAWEHAARAALADLAQRAARPWEGAAPPDCPAVLFRDEAELLACLALDVSRGRAVERWWWQMIPGRRRWGGLTAAVLPALLLDQPAMLPAVLRLLRDRSVAAAVVQRLTRTEAIAVLQAMAAAHGVELPALTTLAAPASWQQAAPAAAAPWRPWLPAQVVADAKLAAPGEALLGVALTLATAPSVVRRPDFRAAVERWQHGQEGEASVQPRAQTPLILGAPGQAIHPEVMPRAAVVLSSDQAVAAGQSGDAPSKVDADDGASPRARAPRQQTPGSPLLAEPNASAQPAGESGPLPSLAAASSAALPAGAVSQAASAEPAPPVAPEAPAAEGVTTELGGVLFLLNVMQQLDLPDCFEPEWRLASQVGSWATLELLARGLLSQELPTSPKIGTSEIADPLWAALAALAGRPTHEMAGASLAGPDHVQIPDGWARWLGADGVAGQHSDLAGAASLVGPLVDGVSPDLRRWLAGVTPLVQGMLQRALGDGFDVVHGLLLRRAQLYVTFSHVDMVLPLESVSIPVRMAGLDFDPGWLPAFGRVVQFHYE